MRSYRINHNDAGQRVDKFIGKAVPKLPQSLMYKYIRIKRIKLNHSRCEISTRLKEGDILELYINDEFFEAPSESDFLLVSSRIDPVYEDENILIVDKPCGLVVHEDDDNTIDTLINRVKKYLYEKGEYKPEEEASFAPSLCNRLDRNTEGLVICAKNAESLRILNLAVKERRIRKKYLCAVIGEPTPHEAVIKAYLVKNEAENMVRIYDKPVSSAKEIVTSYKVISTNGDLSLCEIDLITGRTHQIRAHMAHIGHPVLGDGKYGSGEINRRYSLKTQALQAHSLKFELGDIGGNLSYLDGREFTAKPAWFQEKFFPDCK
ncbi:MAG: RluA family pseudouridine synthase [Oscillospiraceae bacterium]|nr:RluA family pseudouridine synthase [Oscillospiraceae bacterium]